MSASHPSRMLRWYFNLWVDCFCVDEGPFVNFLARASLICLNAGIGFALAMVVAWGVHFWRLYVR